MSVITKMMFAVWCYEAVSVKANSRSDVKRSGRSQNDLIGLPV
ncbi:MAG: hypothetical protein Q7T58_11225 [Methylotenera sp.]|nr:hypothetical protein [Methylotenera sp.]